MRIEYDGPVYIRPCGRGVILGDLLTEGQDLEDWLGGIIDPTGAVGYSRDWSGHMRITVEIADSRPQLAEAQKALVKKMQLPSIDSGVPYDCRRCRRRHVLTWEHVPDGARIELTEEAANAD